MNNTEMLRTCGYCALRFTHTQLHKDNPFVNNGLGAALLKLQSLTSSLPDYVKSKIGN